MALVLVTPLLDSGFLLLLLLLLLVVVVVMVGNGG